jgi:hypothetical protein
VGQKSLMDEAAKGKILAIQAIKSKPSRYVCNPCRLLFEAYFLLNICKNGYYSKLRDWILFTLCGLYHSRVKGCTNPGCQVGRATNFFDTGYDICGSSVRNLLHAIFIAPRPLRRLSDILEHLCTPDIVLSLCARAPTCVHTGRDRKGKRSIFQ